MKKLNAAVALVVVSLVTFPFDALAWNIPGHMLSGAIAYQILQRENPSTITTIRSVLEKNPWFETRWKSQLGKLPEAARAEMLFMLAARWADDIRTRDKAQSRLPWHYIDLPFKPEDEPASIQPAQPPHDNILTAIAENERIVGSGSDPTRRGIYRRHPPTPSCRRVVLAGRVIFGEVPTSGRAWHRAAANPRSRLLKTVSISTWNTGRTAAKP